MLSRLLAWSFRRRAPLVLLEATPFLGVTGEAFVEIGKLPEQSHVVEVHYLGGFLSQALRFVAVFLGIGHTRSLWGDTTSYQREPRLTHYRPALTGGLSCCGARR